MKDVSTKTSIIGSNLQLTLSFTFTKPMPKSDIIVRTWDADRNVRNTRYQDAIQIVKTTLPDSQVPSWVKNNAKWWSEGTIEDKDFTNGLQFMIQSGIIKVPPTKIQGEHGTMPAWIKNNAKWWADGMITENDFVQGMQWMIANGILKL